MVISPITLDDNYGSFYKDGDQCLMLDMDCVHEVGLAKYDFLILKTVQVIRDTCNYLGTSYPRTHEVDWEDENVWRNMLKSPCGIFQMESSFAFNSLRKFKPTNIFELAHVTAAIRPSGASYRDNLLARKKNKCPSEMIEELLKDNLGYLIYQEDTIKFLQDICGLSGSEADNIRRAIGRKDKERLDEALPSILEGYCNKSSKPRDIAEKEAEEFLQIIEDSASYQFGMNHAIAYCLMSYLCAYYRYYHPLEFLTAFLNDAANDEDIKNGTEYAGKIGIKVTMPKWGISRSEYSYDSEKGVIAKGLSSIKYMSKDVADKLYFLAHSGNFLYFVDVLNAIFGEGCADLRQVDILIRLDFFSEFGKQTALRHILKMYDEVFRRGEAKSIARELVDGSVLEAPVKRHSTARKKDGSEAKRYTILDINAIMRELEDIIKQDFVSDISNEEKAANSVELLGYMGYVSGEAEDRRKLYITDVYPLCRRKDGKQFGYSVLTKSIGSGKESRFTVYNRRYIRNPIAKGDIILCEQFSKENIYFVLDEYSIISYNKVN